MLYLYCFVSETCHKHCVLSLCVISVLFVYIYYCRKRNCMSFQQKNSNFSVKVWYLFEKFEFSHNNHKNESQRYTSWNDANRSLIRLLVSELLASKVVWLLLAHPVYHLYAIFPLPLSHIPSSSWISICQIEFILY